MRGVWCFGQLSITNWVWVWILINEDNQKFENMSFQIIFPAIQRRLHFILRQWDFKQAEDIWLIFFYKVYLALLWKFDTANRPDNTYPNFLLRHLQGLKKKQKQKTTKLQQHLNAKTENLFVIICKKFLQPVWHMELDGE